MGVNGLRGLGADNSLVGEESSEQSGDGEWRLQMEEEGDFTVGLSLLVLLFLLARFQGIARSPPLYSVEPRWGPRTYGTRTSITQLQL